MLTPYPRPKQSRHGYEVPAPQVPNRASATNKFRTNPVQLQPQAREQQQAQAARVQNVKKQ